ncbi:rRNA (guanine-N(2)-)-methyltransferase [Halosimplex carlsbadense 2-9-1]|uniref:rRNA (Guanine-N(2)-)-methyltransferase n=1 Tax=Halosimplex carlsbadense 2-9-1 TaxID=797114 RepID=M0CNE9_9EURY|nr:methyltransferase [Halosimplex carlsbadense]ELZ24148.1 rRNA (guanine-N(2)-)-methyltransferase [Halosimplex carlsbadense 2-9-1]
MTPRRDPLVLGSRTDAGPDRFEFHTAEGVPDADAFCPGELLALERLWDRDCGRLRTVGARYGVVGVVLAGRAASVRMATPSARAAALCERNATENGVDATVELATGLAGIDGPPAEPVDTAVYVPEPYTPLELGTRRLRSALDSLASDGALYLAAKPETGLGRYEDALTAAAAEVSTVAERDGWSLLRAIGSATADGGRPGYGPEPPFDRVGATVDGVDFELVTAPGLFAAGGLDHGTRLLAETATVTGGDRVLDLCCGYGPLAAYAGRSADCDVWATDDDALATAAAERTLAETDVDARVVTADCTAGVADRSFDAVLCNPPTHAGSGVLADLFRGAADALAPDGRCWVVHHRALDLSDSLAAFGRVETVATGTEHVVRSARR